MKRFPYVVLAVVLTVISGCRARERSAQSSSSEAKIPSNALRLTFTYGSEKEEWIRLVTEAFNASEQKTADGKPIYVEAFPMGSGDCIDELINDSGKGGRQTDLTSPASDAFIDLGNAQWRVKSGKDLIGKTEHLVLSPVVIAMWKPMAEALGWPQKALGWSDILALARDENGWAAHGHPEWGRFRFGHTSPESSNSGLISIFAETYAATGKKAGLELTDVAAPETAEFVGGIERSVVHYGSSTGFFGRKMFANGPQYLSAAVLYENMVIESYGPQHTMPFPVVAIYPKEGTFWSDHPVGIVDRDWVTPEKRAAAKIYIDYLLAREQQAKAIPFGFRPASTEVQIGAPIDAAHGVDPMQPKTTLEVPHVEVMNAILRLWQQNKKHANVTLVFDTSGSMEEGRKLENAREGAQQLVQMLGDGDEFSFLPFNASPRWALRNTPIRTGRSEASQRVGGVFAEGGTALYDAIATAYDAHLASSQADREKISAIVVLTDGDDTDSNLPLDDLLTKIRFDNERHTIRVFTIAYGDNAKTDVLQKIADATEAKFYKGDQQNIRSVLREISTFF